MLKKLLIVAIASAASVAAYAADSNASQGYVEAKQAKQVAGGDNQGSTGFDANKTADSTQKNSPTVSSFAASSQLFPQQNQLTGVKGQKYNTSKPIGQNMPTNKKSFDQNNSNNANQDNSPTVSSFAYSGAQFPEQNAVIGQKGAKYYSESQVKQHVNNPTVNSRLSSANMFPQENSFNNNGKTTNNSGN